MRALRREPALGAVTIRKAAVASLQKRSLLKRASKLLARIQESKSVHALKKDMMLLEEGILTADQFAVLLDEHVDSYRKIP